jgi:hypothetical protein
MSKNVTRATGLSTASAIGVSVFGGTMRIVTDLIGVAGDRPRLPGMSR